MASRQLTSLALTKAYLRRIGRIDPLLGAVIETNPRPWASPRNETPSESAGGSAVRFTGSRSSSRTTSRRPTAWRRRPDPWPSSGARCPRTPRWSRRCGAPGRSSSARPTCPSGPTSAASSRRASPTAGPPEAASPGTRTSSTGTRAVPAPGRRWRRRRTCARPRSAARRTARSCARPATTGSSGSSRPLVSCRRTGSSRSPTRRTRQAR